MWLPATSRQDRRQGRQKRRYKGTFKDFLKRLQVNPRTWENLAQNRLARRREVKTSATIYETNRITATLANSEAPKSQAPRLLNAKCQSLTACPRCERLFRARIGLVGYLWTQCVNNPTTPTFPTLTRVANPETTTTSVTADHTVAVPPPLTTDIARSAPTVVSITVDNSSTTISRTPPPQRQHLMSHKILPPTVPPPVMWTWLISVLTVIENSPLTPAWSVTGESIIRRLTNQCLEHQTTLNSSACTVNIAPHILSPHGPTRSHAYSLKTAWTTAGYTTPSHIPRLRLNHQTTSSIKTQR
ncbi:hypothetical protein SprV_0100438200 [Sparganum proliferum]